MGGFDHIDKFRPAPIKLADVPCTFLVDRDDRAADWFRRRGIKVSLQGIFMFVRCSMDELHEAERARNSKFRVFGADADTSMEQAKKQWLADGKLRRVF